jgi:hypothetical protein
MSTGTTHMYGQMAGAARLRTCDAHRAIVGTLASGHEQKWLGARSARLVSPVVFATNRPSPRPPERSP